MHDPSILGRVLRKLRKRAGKSQREVAGLSGLSRSTISRIERGKRALMDLETPQIIAALNTSREIFDKQLDYVDFLEKSAAKGREVAETERLEQERKKALRQPLSRSEVMAILLGYFKDKPVKEVGLFGSFARDEQTLDSDIDVYICFDDTKNHSFLDVGAYTVELQEMTGYSVDVVDQDNLYDHVRSGLEADKITIYGKKNTTDEAGKAPAYERSR